MISLLQNLPQQSSGQVVASHQMKNLQAMVVTPNEEAVILIKWHKPSIWKPSVSRISAGRLYKIGEQGEHRALGTFSAEQDLQYYLEKPAKCDVVIEEHTSTSTKIRVLIAHHNGHFEVSDLDLPRSNDGLG